MFVAVELAFEYAIRRPADVQALEEVITEIKCVESQYPAFLKKPSPNGDAELLACLANVCEMERRRGVYRTNPNEPIRLHHEAESIWWTLLWANVRALPLGKSDQPTLAWKHFCETLVGEPHGSKILRAQYLHSADGALDELLHPDLQFLARTLELMALYLSVPWHIYISNGVIQEDHAQRVFRGLLLSQLIRLQAGNTQPDVQLDRTVLRTHLVEGSQLC